MTFPNPHNCSQDLNREGTPPNDRIWSLPRTQTLNKQQQKMSPHCLCSLIRVSEDFAVQSVRFETVPSTSFNSDLPNIIRAPVSITVDILAKNMVLMLRIQLGHLDDAAGAAWRRLFSSVVYVSMSTRQTVHFCWCCGSLNSFKQWPEKLNKMWVYKWNVWIPHTVNPHIVFTAYVAQCCGSGHPNTNI